MPYPQARPSPRCPGLSVKNGSKILGIAAGSMPQPSSVISTQTYAPGARLTAPSCIGSWYSWLRVSTLICPLVFWAAPMASTEFYKRLLQLGLVEMDRKNAALKFLRPDQILLLRRFKELHRAAHDRVQVARYLGALVLLLEAERREVLRDFRGLFGCFLRFPHRKTPRMVGLHLAEDIRSVPDDAGQGVVEIERDRAGQLHRAIQSLLVSEVDLDSLAFVLGWRRRRGRLNRKQLKEKILLGPKLKRRDGR